MVLPSHPAFWEWATSRFLSSFQCEAVISRVPGSYHGSCSNKPLYDMHSFYLTLMLWLRQCIVLLPEVMGFIKTKSQQNKLSIKFRILLYELLAKGFLGTPQRILAIVIALCCLWELHGKTLVLKLLCTWAKNSKNLFRTELESLSLLASDHSARKRHTFCWRRKYINGLTQV